MNVTSPTHPRTRSPRLLVRALSAFLLIGGVGLATSAPASAEDQPPINVIPISKVCPDGDGWKKYDGLSGLSFSMPAADIPAGYEVTASCMKVSDHSPVFGTGTTVTNNSLYNSPGGAICTAPGVPHNGCSLQNISHASFKLERAEQVTPIENLNLTFMQECPQPGDPSTWLATWRIRNPNAEPVDFTVDKAGTGQILNGTAPSGDSTFTTPWGAQTLILRWQDENGANKSKTKAGGDTAVSIDTDKCRPEQPADDVQQVTVDGTIECDATTVATTTTTTTTAYVWTGSEWVLDTDNAEVVVTQGERELTAEEQEACPTSEEPETPVVESQPPVEEDEKDVASLTPVAPGPVSPPATQTPAPEAPVAQAPPAPAADPVQAPLPSTGSTSGILAAVAGLLMLAGFGLRRFGPQRIDQLG